jgi:ribosomal protein S18 acetylase RimI-like enzyme
MSAMPLSKVPVVRPCEPADRPALSAIYRECRGDAAWLPDGVRASSDFERDTAGEAILVAVDGDGDAVGFLSVWAPGRFIHHLYVSPCARRRGAGTALLDALALPKPWRLKCVRANVDATAFYVSRGWVEVGSGTSAEGAYAVMEKTS